MGISPFTFPFFSFLSLLFLQSFRAHTAFVELGGDGFWNDRFPSCSSSSLRVSDYSGKAKQEGVAQQPVNFDVAE